MPLTLGQIAERFGLRLFRDDDPNLVITGITLDSRAVRPGDLFAALPGEHTHGATFIEQARELGAVAVLTDPGPMGYADRTGVDYFHGLPVLVAEDPRAALGAVSAAVYGDPATGLTVIGITGTNGKTTTAALLAAGLSKTPDRRVGVIGTTGVRIGDEMLPSARTTPEATDLHALLAVMRERGVNVVVMEVSSHALVLGRVDGLVFDVAIFTQLSQDHLDFHGTMEDYFAAKASLFTPERARRAVIGLDSMWGRRLADTCQIPATTYALRQDAQVTCREILEEMGRQTLVIDDGSGHLHRVTVGLPGEFNAANGLAAWSALRLLDVPPAIADTGMADVHVPGRMEVVDVGQPFVVLVDYAHTPDAVERVLTAVTPADGGRRIAVLGCGGDRDRDKRPHMGGVAALRSDVLIVTDDNPRTEDPAAIRAAMIAGTEGLDADIREIGDRRAAIATAIAEARPGDVVLVLGKGHEPGQEIAGVVHPFSDREAVLTALGATA